MKIRCLWLMCICMRVLFILLLIVDLFSILFAVMCSYFLNVVTVVSY